MSAPEDRTRIIALLRALADLLENDESLPVPHGYLTVFPHSTAATAAFLSLPTPWRGEAPAPGGDFYSFTGDIGSYTHDGIRISMRARPGDVAIEGPAEPVPVMVTMWEPLPEIAALLESTEGEAGEPS